MRSANFRQLDYNVIFSYIFAFFSSRFFRESRDKAIWEDYGEVSTLGNGRLPVHWNLRRSCAKPAASSDADFAAPDWTDARFHTNDN
jgi:hypothetical protein